MDVPCPGSVMLNSEPTEAIVSSNAAAKQSVALEHSVVAHIEMTSLDDVAKAEKASHMASISVSATEGTVARNASISDSSGGEGARRVVIFLHGLGGTGEGWIDFLGTTAIQSIFFASG
jgi:hypothetical protein